MYGFNFLGINVHDHEHSKEKPSTNESSLSLEDLLDLKNKIEELKALKELLENSGISEVTSDIEDLKGKVALLTTDVSDNDSPEIDSIPEVYALLNDFERGDKIEEVSEEKVGNLFDNIDYKNN